MALCDTLVLDEIEVIHSDALREGRQSQWDDIFNEVLSDSLVTIISSLGA